MIHEQIQDVIVITTQASCPLYILICTYFGGKQKTEQTNKKNLLPMYRALQQQWTELSSAEESWQIHFNTYWWRKAFDTTVKFLSTAPTHSDQAVWARIVSHCYWYLKLISDNPRVGILVFKEDLTSAFMKRLNTLYLYSRCISKGLQGIFLSEYRLLRQSLFSSPDRDIDV